MGFSNMFNAPEPPTTVAPPPPTVTETQETDVQADYNQRASRRRGLLSTILSNRNRGTSGSSGKTGSNTTLG